MNNEPLEDFIRKKRGEFDIYSPNNGIWHGIALKRKKPFRKKPPVKTFLRIAAVGIIFFLSYAYHEFRDSRKNQMNEKLYAALPEIRETELYYGNLVNLKLKELQPFLKDIPEIKGEISNDFSELDSMYLSLKKDLLDNVANDEVLEAMIQNYRLKLQILEELLIEVKHESNIKKHGKNKNRV